MRIAEIMKPMHMALAATALIFAGCQQRSEDDREVSAIKHAIRGVQTVKEANPKIVRLYHPKEVPGYACGVWIDQIGLEHPFAITRDGSAATVFGEPMEEKDGTHQWITIKDICGKDANKL